MGIWKCKIYLDKNISFVNNINFIFSHIHVFFLCFIFSGLIIEFGSVCTVLIASNLGIPISTTHCLVGAIVLVGLVRSRNVTEWKVFFNILIAWLITVPVSGKELNYWRWGDREGGASPSNG